MDNETDLVERVLNFNNSLNDNQRGELVEIISIFKNRKDYDLIPGIFLITNPEPTLEDIEIAAEILEGRKIHDLS